MTFETGDAPPTFLDHRSRRPQERAAPRLITDVEANHRQERATEASAEYDKLATALSAYQGDRIRVIADDILHLTYGEMLIAGRGLAAASGNKLDDAAAAHALHTWATAYLAPPTADRAPAKTPVDTSSEAAARPIRESEQ